MIFLGTLRTLTIDDMVKYIRTFDASKLTESILIQCQISLPTTDEEKLLIGLDSKTPNLRNAERFMLMVHFLEEKWLTIYFVDVGNA